jgi:hypothetical protein
MGHLNKSLSGTASDAEFTTAMVGCPTVTVTLGSSTDGDLFMHYYQFNIGDYLKATAHLSPEEDLTYRRLLDHYYDTEKPIPNDLTLVAKKLRVKPEWVEAVLTEFLPQLKTVGATNGQMPK